MFSGREHRKRCVCSLTKHIISFPEAVLYHLDSTLPFQREWTCFPLQSWYLALESADIRLLYEKIIYICESFPHFFHLRVFNLKWGLSFFLFHLFCNCCRPCKGKKNAHTVLYSNSGRITLPSAIRFWHGFPIV